MIAVYGDDSSDGEQKRVFAVASLVGKQEAWDSLEPIWKERTGGIPYHATDCLARQKAYEGWSKEESCALHNDLTRLIVEFPIEGHAFVMDVPSFAEIFHVVKRTNRFLYCFAHMLGGTCALIRRYNADHEQDQNIQRAKFSFDSDNDQFNAGYLYSVLTKMKQWDELMQDCDGPVEFAFPDGKPVGIQAADIWAYEVRNEFENKLRGISVQTYASSLLAEEPTRFNRTEYFGADILTGCGKIVSGERFFTLVALFCQS